MAGAWNSASFDFPIMSIEIDNANPEDKVSETDDFGDLKDLQCKLTYENACYRTLISRKYR
jgi:hypothetical protein